MNPLGPTFLWFPDDEGSTPLLALLGFGVALPAGIATFFAGDWKRPTLIAAAASLALMIAFAVLRGFGVVSVSADTVVIEHGGAAKDTRLPLTDVVAIEAGCGSIRGSKYRGATPSLSYGLKYATGQEVWLQRGVPGSSAFAVSSWLRAVEGIDRSPDLSDTPRRWIARGVDRSQCLSRFNTSEFGAGDRRIVATLIRP